MTLSDTYCFDLNRPFHLGRRDVFFVKATEMIKAGLVGRTAAGTLDQVELVIHHLRSALDHAATAIKARNPKPAETAFIQFTELLLDRLAAMRALLGCAVRVSDTGSPLHTFLAGGSGQAERNGLDYERIVQELADDMAKECERVELPFDAMRAECLSALDPAEKARYDKATEGLFSHLASSHGRRRLKRPVQTFY